MVLARPQDSIDQAALELDKFVAADSNYDDLSKRLHLHSESKLIKLYGTFSILYNPSSLLLALL